MIILGGGRTGKNLADVIDDGVTSCAQFTNDFEFGRWFLMVCGRSVLCRAVSNETERFAQKGNSLANDVTVGKDILDVGREGRVVLGGRGRRGKVVRVRRRIGWTGDDLGKGGGRKGWGRKGGKRS